MDGTKSSTGTEPLAPFLTDEQYELLFDEPRPHIAVAPTRTTRRTRSETSSGTRWDRRAPTADRHLAPPPVPTLDLTGAESRLELDIFADDRSTRVMDVARSARVRAIVAADEVSTATAAAREARTRRNVRNRAVSLAFAFAGLTATIALWMIAIVVYY